MPGGLFDEMQQHPAQVAVNDLCSSAGLIEVRSPGFGGGPVTYSSRPGGPDPAMTNVHTIRHVRSIPMSGRLADNTNRSAGSGEGQRASIGFSPPALDFVRRSGRARGKARPGAAAERTHAGNTVRVAGNTVGDPDDHTSGTVAL
jgi:hypothetical protein